MKEETTIVGIRAIIEAIKSGKTIDKVFVQKGLRGELFLELDHLLPELDFIIIRYKKDPF